MTLQKMESDASDLLPKVIESLKRAEDYASARIHKDGHWCGELRSNVAITAEYVMLRQSLGLDPSLDRDALVKHLFDEQNEDGSWAIAPFYPGDVSTTVEAYLALKMLGFDPDGDERMNRARDFILSVGGLGKVRIFTRFYLAMFGLFPWTAVPELPAEAILLPTKFPINIYKFSSWARSSIVPMLVLSHHKPLYPLPGRLPDPESDFIDELWRNPSQKQIAYSTSLWQAWYQSSWFGFATTLIDKAFSYTRGVKLPLLRSYARRKCVSWILERQEDAGDWAGIFPPMHLGILALILEGLSQDHPRIQAGLQAVERFTWKDSRNGKRVQSCVSPVWDTILMNIGLLDVGHDPASATIIEATEWVKTKQILHHDRGDWRVYSQNQVSGGFSFEYHNTWYPDVDDTAAAVLSFLKQDPINAPLSPTVTNALTWILGMQNRDGGWGAFDTQNDNYFLHDIPFSDMDSLCDPSTPDVTGRILEALGLWFQCLDSRCPTYPPGRIAESEQLTETAKSAVQCGLEYLRQTQYSDGSWFGRWGVNFVYGTSNVLCGLVYFKHHQHVTDMVRSGVSWMIRMQNPDDGGWGEDPSTYFPFVKSAQARSMLDAVIKADSTSEKDTPLRSTPSQTAWALMALISHCPATDSAITNGIAYLTRTQTKEVDLELVHIPVAQNVLEQARSWNEQEYTGTGFPGFFYLGYEFYSHYFPMMALGRWARAMKEMKKLEACKEE